MQVLSNDDLLSIPSPHRIQLKDERLNVALGGGAVEGTVVLITGEAGVGKSTLLLHSVPDGSLVNNNEEDARAFAHKARGSGKLPDNVTWLFDSSLQHALSLAANQRPPALVIDSLQETNITDPIAVVEACKLLARSTGIIVFIVGHVNAKGRAVGQERIRHLVDAQIHMPTRQILTVMKNRFPSLELLPPPQVGANEEEEADTFLELVDLPPPTQVPHRSSSLVHKILNVMGVFYTIFAILGILLAYGGRQRK